MLSTAQLVSYTSISLNPNNYSYSICTDISILVLVLYLLYPLVLTLNLVVFRYLVGCHFVGSLYLPGSSLLHMCMYSGRF